MATQNATGNAVPEEYKDAGGTQTAGVLVIGKAYRIKTYVALDVFTNVGAGSDATGVEFIATDTTPTTYTNGSTLERIGAFASYQGRNIESNGDWLDDSSNGYDATNSNATAMIVPPGASGTWTPSMSFATPVTTACSYSQQLGTWVKLAENTYYVRCRFQLSSKGDNTGKATFEGFPWAFSSSNASQILLTELHAMNANITMRVGVRLAVSAATGVPYQQGATSASYLSDTHFTDTSLIMFSGVVTIA